MLMSSSVTESTDRLTDIRAAGFQKTYFTCVLASAGVGNKVKLREVALYTVQCST